MKTKPLGAPRAPSQEAIREELEKRGWALSALSEAAAALARANSTELLIQEVCEAIAAQGPYVLAWVGRAENDAFRTVKVVGAAGSAVGYISNILVSWSESEITGRGPAGSCIRNNKTSVVIDGETDSGFEAWRQRAKEFGIRSVIGCPIPDGFTGMPFGSLMVYSKVPNTFGASEVQLFESLAKEIGFGLRSIERQHKLDDQIHEKELTQERLSTALRSTIEAMSKTMEWRDPYTAGHQKRVASISMAIARKLGWENERIQALYMAAMVHDIGKMAVPSEVLTKPSRLTDLEMQLVQGHVEAGYQILKDIPFPWPIADMVHQHHERLDGSGYPNHLQGDQICEEARVLAVADTIEAMATHRPYRPAKGLVAALDEVRVEAGIKLDARVVDAAFKLLTGENELQKIIDTQ
ncbi:HD domain-containing protein [Polynucleobacter sp. AP-Capit-er-40B-B4]|uniref:HD domain-containing phosphohydrolase n=1 Tax=Polynucleobacter sp. AP-Capit-er-40B-B4 TaxID=2576927 RepID=UPI001C0E5252|nr:HD domain-containing phosphohydrolase [Polynucleobacter sp. AP-Capit-er-40B-B4]MBU3582277.1 HD domain-containing protein [Polynucleobacter sp. AP-Capit-er-40B-B4]